KMPLFLMALNKLTNVGSVIRSLSSYLTSPKYEQIKYFSFSCAPARISPNKSGGKKPDEATKETVGLIALNPPINGCENAPSILWVTATRCLLPAYSSKIKLIDAIS